MPFDFDSATRRRLGYKMIDHIDAYFSSLSNRRVQLPLDQRTFDDLHDRLPELGEDADRVLTDLCTELTEKGFHVTRRKLLWPDEPNANLHGCPG